MGQVVSAAVRAVVPSDVGRAEVPLHEHNAAPGHGGAGTRRPAIEGLAGRALRVYLAGAETDPMHEFSVEAGHFAMV